MSRQLQRKAYVKKKSVEFAPIDWRSAALEALPELEPIMEEIEAPMRLWNEIHLIFEKAYRQHRETRI